MCYGLLYKCAMFDIERDPEKPIRNIDEEYKVNFRLLYVYICSKRFNMSPVRLTFILLE